MRTGRNIALVALALCNLARAQAGDTKPDALPDFQALLRVATTAMSECRKQGFPVTVVIVNEEGVPRIVLRDDHASPHTPESAERKAYTAATFGMATAKLGELGTRQPDFAWLGKLDKVLFVGGGLPMRMGERLIGGIGVAGGVGPGIDERCASAGLAALAG